MRPLGTHKAFVGYMTKLRGQCDELSGAQKKSGNKGEQLPLEGMLGALSVAEEFKESMRMATAGYLEQRMREESKPLAETAGGAAEGQVWKRMHGFADDCADRRLC